MRNLLYIILGVVVFAACIEDEEFADITQPCLTFSVDSVDFDTLIAGQRSVTHSFRVYNPTDKNVKVTNVQLTSAAEGVFRANVYGAYVEEGVAADFELRAKDSITIFVDAMPPTTDSDTPVSYDAQLLFYLQGGAVQFIDLHVAGQEFVTYNGLVVTSDTVFTAKRPFHIIDSLVVETGATLTIEPGVVLMMSADASVDVRGRLVACGNAGAPIVFRGDRLDDMFKDQPYDRISGQWGGVRFRASSFENKLDFVDIHSATYGVYCDSSSLEPLKLQLENSVVHNVVADALSLYACSSFVGNTQISNAGGNCVTVRGGNHQFVHCTLAQFYPFSAMRGSALNFANCEGDLRYPLEKLAFVNSIITGYAMDEIMGASSDRYKDDAFNYSFDHCLLNTPAYESPNLKDCVWDDGESGVSRADNFAPAFDVDKLIFTFGLSPESAAVGSADAQVTATTYPLDRNGIPRNMERPDMGCYTFVPNDSVEN